jgi:hypothetical protein
MSMNSFQLKGGGWYATDYAKKTDKSAPAASKPKDAADKGAPAAPKTDAPAKDKTAKEA